MNENESIDTEVQQICYRGRKFELSQVNNLIVSPSIETQLNDPTLPGSLIL